MNKYLQLHRASAGSGKTYQLAKEFIWLYLTTKEDDGARHLRTAGEFAEAFPHILAITFTNKATNEMKKRIVDRLFDLTPESGLPDHKVDYLEEFSNRLGVEPKLIRERSKDALRALLFGYTGFNVSTIDSFFQTVLRAFAYETNLRSSYQVEVESDFVTSSAVDATLSEVNRKDAPEEIRYWINSIIKANVGKSKDWNLFQKKVVNKGEPSPYQQLLYMASANENEKYQEIVGDIKSYFDNPENDYRKSFEALDNLILGLKKKYREELISTGHEWIEATGGEESTRHNANFMNGWKKIFSAGIDYPFVSSMSRYSSAFKSAYKGKPSDEEKKIDQSYQQRCLDLHEKCLHIIFDIWTKMRPDLMNLGLSSAIDRNARMWLEENNLVQLSQTNMILKRIINRDDAPFIYEKVGTRLRHYLIDEFQDTSDLQWENLRPLVAESLSEDNENLIIGDAKQSIYRFRNANMNLIADTVPNKDFPGCDVKGMKPKENTNFRSAPNIIRFNNALFELLPTKLETPDHPKTSMKNIYTGATQQIPESTLEKGQDRGYVEFNFLAWSNKNGSEDEEPYPKPLLKLGDQIMEIMSRGFRMCDIAILVRKNDEGREVIAALMDYNAQHPDNKVDVISDESLLVSTSNAVNSVVEILHMMVQPSKDKDTAESGTKKRYLNANEIATNFNFYLIELKRKGEEGTLTRAEHLAKFLENPEVLSSLDNVLHNLQAMTLPAVVESVIGTFITEEERKRDLPFLAAFQDAVMEFSASKGSDIQLFLEWWDKKKESLSIASPAGADAVSVMTIHKSKGLEFPVVILPLLNFGPNKDTTKTEWIPPEELLQMIPEENRPTEMPALPPYIPLRLNLKFPEDSRWARLKSQAQYEERTDALNSLYVAFTRAIDELYVNVKANSKDPANQLIHDIMQSEIPGVTETELPQPEEDDKKTPAPVRLTYGTKMIKKTADDTDKEEEEDKDKEEEKKPEVSVLPLERYEVNMTHPKVAREDTSLNQGEDEAPRSRGTRLHEIMSMVNTLSDLPNAIRRYRILGKISAKESVEFEEYLHNAIEDAQIREFFSDKYRVLNEREMLTRGMNLKSTQKSGILRPDRIMVERDNPENIVVLDYKFGNREKASLYRQQISDYINALRTAHPEKEISGLLWYVELGIKETV